MDKMLNANVLPVVQIGKDYRVTRKQIDDWFKRNSGKHIFYFEVIKGDTKSVPLII